MPSNSCTNSLMELSFAIGNMIGAQECDADDWKQLRTALASWECSDRGKSGDALQAMKGTIGNAVRACESSDGCRAADCEDLFDDHEVLIQALNIYEPTQIGRGYRGAIPPKIKGSQALERTGGLPEQRTAEVRRIAARQAAELAEKTAEATRRQEAADALQKEKQEAADKLKKEKEEGGGGRYSPLRGMGYGDEERRKRWYPSQV